jgi:hypothetical protein
MVDEQPSEQLIRSIEDRVDEQIEATASDLCEGRDAARSIRRLFLLSELQARQTVELNVPLW